MGRLILGRLGNKKRRKSGIRSYDPKSPIPLGGHDEKLVLILKALVMILL
jgi:hypothetical protein